MALRPEDQPIESNHIDEGTLHAWLDGALTPVEAEAVEAHIRECEACAQAAAEARGLVAAAARILTALDDVPSGVLPGEPPLGGVEAGAGAEWRLGASGRRRRPFYTRWPVRIAATILVVAAGSLVIVQQTATDHRESSDVAPTGVSAERDTVVAPAPAPVPPSSAVGPAQEPPPATRAPAPAPALARAPARESKAEKQAAPPVDEADQAATAPRAAPADAAPAPAPPVAPAPQVAQAQARRIGGMGTLLKGRVTASGTGAPVRDATVRVDSLSNVTALTDSNGQYVVVVPDSLARARVQVRRIGYGVAKAEVPLNKDSTRLDIAMSEDRTRLDQVVVSGVAGGRAVSAKSASPAAAPAATVATPPAAAGCYRTTDKFFPSRFTLDSAAGDTLPLSVSGGDSLRFGVAYWMYKDAAHDTISLFVAQDSTTPGVHIQAAITPKGLIGVTIPPDDAVSQPSTFTATRCRPGH